MPRRTRPTRRARDGRRPPRKPLEKFLDNVANMLETVAATAVFSGGAVLLGRMLGTPPPPLELPPGLPPEVRDELRTEWERLLGGKPGTATVRTRRAKAETGIVVEDQPDSPPPEPVKLLKGPDGVYRPET